MNYTKFQEMTKSDPTRWIVQLNRRLKACRFQVKKSVYELLAKLRLVVKHVKSDTIIKDSQSPIALPDIMTNRFVFSNSYLLRDIMFIDEYWFESRRGKKLFVITDRKERQYRLSFRLDLKNFLAKFPRNHEVWVDRKRTTVVIPENFKSFAFNENNKTIDRVNTETYHCDVTDCRYAYEFSYNVEEKVFPLEDVISESCRVISSGLMSKIEEINEKVTKGVKNDGELTSRGSQPLAENIVCRKCGYPVFHSSFNRYGYECINHGELYRDNVYRVDNKQYQDNMKNCIEALYKWATN